MPADLDAALAEARAVVAEAIAARPVRTGDSVDAAMRYALEGGKGLRAFLVLAGARLHGAAPPAAGPAAAAIECVHAYSLVHDDLPCMDDDDLRRGRPTVHRRWDEATAVLAGDALQSFAFELILDAPASDAVKVALASGLAVAAGRMVRGQALDIAAETAGTASTLAQVETLQALKTGALIEWSATAGAHLGGGDPAPLLAYGQAVGAAFQIRDDILDVEGSAEETGKAVGKDAGRGKATFVDLLGLEAAHDRARSLADDAIAALAPFGADAEPLRELARFIVTRRS